MSEIQEQTQLASEVSDAISQGTYAGVEFDDVRHRSCCVCVAECLICPLLGTCRMSSSRSWPISSRRSLTRASWRIPFPCTIPAAQAGWKAVRLITLLLVLRNSDHAHLSSLSLQAENRSRKTTRRRSSRSCRPRWRCSPPAARWTSPHAALTLPHRRSVLFASPLTPNDRHLC